MRGWVVRGSEVEMEMRYECFEHIYQSGIIKFGEGNCLYIPGKVLVSPNPSRAVSLKGEYTSYHPVS